MKVTIKKTIEIEGFACIDNIIDYLANHGYELTEKQKKALEKRGHTYSDKRDVEGSQSLYVEVTA